MLKYINEKITVIIPTIGRTSLSDCVSSCLREGCKVMVVSDGYDLSKKQHRFFKWNNVSYYKLGRNYGRIDGGLYYNQIAFTTGAYLADTEFVMGIGDDDELSKGAGVTINSHIIKEPSVDMWIPKLLYSDGTESCGWGKLTVGNISHTCYRTKIFASVPMYHRHNENQFVSDFNHVYHAVRAGYSIKWLYKTCVLIRPKLDGKYGGGQIA